MMRGGFPRLQRSAVLQPGDLQRRIALADRAGHVYPRARLDIVGKAKRIDFRRYCKLQEAHESLFYIATNRLHHRRRRHRLRSLPSFWSERFSSREKKGS